MSRELRATVEVARNLGGGVSMLVWVPASEALDIRADDPITIVIPEVTRRDCPSLDRRKRRCLLVFGHLTPHQFNTTHRDTTEPCPDQHGHPNPTYACPAPAGHK